MPTHGLMAASGACAPPSAPPATADLTVVVPTRNERDNISLLVRRLEEVAPDLQIEVLFVDDSTDDTPLVIRAEASRSSRPIRLLHRAEHERKGGLGGAVHAGLAAASSDLVCVMDADLQHPPELLVALLDEARAASADAVVASRFCAGGDTGEFSTFRVALSRGSALIARGMFPRRLRAVSDPMSGFFLVRRSAVDLTKLRPRGFKILLEILLSGRPLRTSEVAFRFGERHAGGSKASLAEGARYLWRLIELRIGARTVRLAAFGAVGATGVAINAAIVDLLAYPLHVWYPVASVLATQVAILSNYALSELVVFRGVDPSRSRRSRLLTYLLLNNALLAVTLPMLVALVSALGVRLLLANVVTLLVLAVVRFALADRYIWGSGEVRAPRLRLAFRTTRALRAGQRLALEQPESQA